MIAVAKKLGFLKEGQIRKVRYYQGQYSGSMKYGILREELATEYRDKERYWLRESVSFSRLKIIYQEYLDLNPKIVLA